MSKIDVEKTVCFFIITLILLCLMACQKSSNLGEVASVPQNIFSTPPLECEDLPQDPDPRVFKTLDNKSQIKILDEYLMAFADCGERADKLIPYYEQMYQLGNFKFMNTYLRILDDKGMESDAFSKAIIIARKGNDAGRTYVYTTYNSQDPKFNEIELRKDILKWEYAFYSEFNEQTALDAESFYKYAHICLEHGETEPMILLDKFLTGFPKKNQQLYKDLDFLNVLHKKVENDLNGTKKKGVRVH